MALKQKTVIAFLSEMVDFSALNRLVITSALISAMRAADHVLYHGRKLPTILTFLLIAWDDADDSDDGDAGNTKLALVLSSLIQSYPYLLPYTLTSLEEETMSRLGGDDKQKP